MQHLLSKGFQTVGESEKFLPRCNEPTIFQTVLHDHQDRPRQAHCIMILIGITVEEVIHQDK